MSKRVRASHLRGLKRGGSPLSCAVWACGPGSRKEDIGHVVFGKAAAAQNASNGSLELARYEFERDLLAEATHNIDTEEVPECIAAHPGGDGIVCSFKNSCRLYVLQRTGPLEITASEESLVPLQGIGPQNSILFSVDGSSLATGGKDGHLRVFEWPSLKIKFDQPQGCKFLKSLDLSLDGAFLAAIPDDGNSCRVWDIEKSTVLATIARSEKGEVFGSCRFSKDGTMPFLFIAFTRASKGFIGVWEIEHWSKIGVKQFSKEPITTCTIRHDGRHLAFGTAVGDVYIIEAKKMAMVELVKDAQPSSVAALEFSPNGRALLSTSVDSTARVSKLVSHKEWKEWQIYMLLIMMILGSAVLFYVFFEYSDNFWKFPLGRNQPATPPLEAIYGSQSATDFDGGEFM